MHVGFDISDRRFAAVTWLTLTSIIFLMSAMETVEAAGCPRRCKCSSPTTVTCKSSGLRDLPSGLNEEVDTLDFTQNAVSQLSARALSSVQQLTTLNMENNRITRIKEDAFQNMINLITLNLSGNQLRHITEGSFRGLSKLEILYLSSNRLESIEQGFQDLPALKRLDLTSNRVSTITQYTFRNLQNIRFLILSENSITHIDRRAFQALNNIMYLVLKGNPLGNIDDIVFNSPLLSYVDFSECALRYVPKGLPNSLRYLQLRRNNMTLIHREAFDTTPYLSILVLDENGISMVEHDTFNRLPYLQQLWINGNDLTSIPSRLPASLQRLLMDSNRLGKLMHSFPENAQLDTLSLMGNNISFIAPDALSSLSLIKDVDLSDNHIRSLYPGTFANLTTLDTLQLSKNPLKYFYQDCFEGLFHLRNLDLAYISTNATMHPQAFNDLTAIKHLDLDSSPGLARAILKSPTLLNNLYTVEELNMQAMDFSSLPTEFADVFYNLDALRLTSTRWHCDEDIRWFRDWLQSATLVIETRDDLLCFTPHALHDKPIVDLVDDELAPAVTTFRPLLRQVTAMYFPPVPTVVMPASTTPVPSTKATTTTPIPTRRGGRGRKTTTATTPVLLTTSVTSPINILDPEFESYYDGDLLKDILGGDGVFEPMNRDPGPELNRTDRVPNQNGVIEFIPNSGHMPGRTTSPPFGDESKSSTSSSISATMLVIVAGGILSTIVVLAIAITIIVLGSRRCKRQRKPPTRNGHTGNMNGIPADKKAIQYQHKDSTLYFMAADSDPSQTVTPTPTTNTGSMKSVKSTKSGKNAKVNGTSKERMALVSGRDVNHEGPLKVYKWDEF